MVAGRVLTDVIHGREAQAALLRAFLSERDDLHVTITIGFHKKRPDERLVLIEFLDTQAVFTAPELLGLGRRMLAGIPRARSLGASKSDADELRNFASFLIRNAEAAATISPHGLN